MKTTMRKAALVTAGLAVAGGAVFGATEAFAASPSATPSAASTTSANAAPATSSSKTACKDAAHPAKCTLRRAAGRERGALLKRGAHGQATVKDKAGAYVVHEWQVGKVGSVNGSTVTLTDGTGATWTWSVQSGTTYRVDGAKGSLGGIHAGDTILIRGTQSGGANDATAVFDPNQSKLG
jgi:uncharacterized cupredoxin-like copper-binding protein